ncbi:MAG TPA: enoyl-CoA hydratase/isomerase family protein [Acidimicrobiales bacterium]|nr:enoyl-CoA hydratase/isomerase family protein [Acidimicrobiales bacterium]
MVELSNERSGELLVESDGAVRIVTLNRPDTLNAFSDELHVAFARMWAAFDDDEEVRAVVLTGAGRAFSTGGLLEDFEARRVDLAVRRRSMREARRLVQDMLDVRVPVVAAVNGPAVGLGCTIATLCDVVFMADTAYLADPHVSVALVAGDGGAVTWPTMTSLLRVKHYLFTGERISADEAVSMGLASFVVPADELMEKAIGYAHRLASQPPLALQETKAVLNQHLRQSALNALALGLAAESQAHDTDEYRRVAQGGKPAGGDG